MYEAKLLETTVADGANGISKNASFAILLTYLSNFWRSLQRSLINCKVELKLQQTKYYVLLVSGADNISDNSNHIVFTIKDTKSYVPVVTLSARENEKLSKLLSQGFKRSVYLNEYKTKK